MHVISGVTGHVGSVVASSLLKQGHKIKVLVRDAAKGASWSKQGAEVAVGSLDDEKFLTGVLGGAKGLFTLLPPSYTASNFYAYQRQVADRVAGAVKAAGVPHVVLLSSIGADLDSGNGPIKGLCYCEKAMRATGTKLTAIRAGYFQENIAQSVGPAKSQGIFPNFFPSADHPFPMIATRDIGQLATEALLHPAGKSEIIDLQGPAYSIRQLAEKLGAALGKKLQIVDIPPANHVATLTQAGLSVDLAENFAEMYAGFASGRIKPCGDRMVQGKTTIDEVLPAVLG
jgi:uncharacterized protein YbjT (DUF2867 family)